MQDYASVSGNTVVGDYFYGGGGEGHLGGGGVIVRGGTFIMIDNASVSGNTSYDQGGGVSVGSYSSGGFGNFTMRDNSSVSGNTAVYGGGVFLFYEVCIFRISGGTVFGNDSGITDNTALAGAALNWFADGTAQYGTFDGTNWSGLTDIPVTKGSIGHNKEQIARKRGFGALGVM